jgi:hypothetical protein
VSSLRRKGALHANRHEAGLEPGQNLLTQIRVNDRFARAHGAGMRPARRIVRQQLESKDGQHSIDSGGARDLTFALRVPGLLGSERQIRSTRVLFAHDLSRKTATLFRIMH